jgi:hypothetical protein
MAKIFFHRPKSALRPDGHKASEAWLTIALCAAPEDVASVSFCIPLSGSRNWVAPVFIHQFGHAASVVKALMGGEQK